MLTRSVIPIAPVTVSPLGRGAILRHHLRTVWPWLAVCVPVTAFVLLLYLGWPVYTARDTSDSPLRSGRAVVVGAVAGTATRTHWTPETIVTLRLEGEQGGADVLASYKTYALPTPRVGQSVQARYRVGRSGRIYVEEAMPVTQ